jgi:tetratricopeptide (TPR) repeat protein
MTYSKDFDGDILVEARESFIAGNYQLAEPILQQLILKNSRNPEVFQMLATIYYDKGQFNKAIRTFKRALEIDPTYTDASVGLSIILNDLGRYDEGKQIFQEAQKLLDRRKNVSDPYLDEKIASKHEELAELYVQARRYNEALDQLLKAQKLSSRKAEISMRIADCFVHLQNNENAIKELRNLIREYPHLNSARIKLGQIYFGMQNVAEATEQWENVLIRDPRNPEALRLLNMANATGITTLSP